MCSAVIYSLKAYCCRQAWKCLTFADRFCSSSSSLQVRLAKRLVEQSFADKVFYANSGTEANEAAIKFSRKHARLAGDTLG